MKCKCGEEFKEGEATCDVCGRSLKKPLRKPVHKDTARLKALIGILQERDGMIGGDFEELLFHAQRATKTRLAAYRKALDEHIKYE